MGVEIQDLSPSQYVRLSELLDESMDLAPEDRSAWLAALDETDATLVGVLRGMLAAQEAERARGFLEGPSPLAGELAAPSAADEGVIGRHFGAYRVLSLLGRGGMGSVWLAERADGLFARKVALKLIHPALIGRVMTERFTREREILGSLDHPNIARLFDAGFSEDGQPFLALEYIAGTPLTSYCDDRCLTVQARLELFRQVLGAVQFAHSHLIIHRDLKPSNILVSEDGQAHLLDFGIAKLLIEGEVKETELTQMGGRALTPDYAAPEQIAGAAITTAADVYSLGVMLYELLAGAPPYRLKRGSRGELEEAILQSEPMPPSRVFPNEENARLRGTTSKKLAGELRGDLDTIVAKSLKKLPAERYATANAFDEDIGRFLGGEVVLAQRDSVAYRALKFARRHRVGLAVAGILILTLAGGLAATSYEARVASVQRDAALSNQLRALTLTAAARLNDNDVPGAMGIVLDILPRRAANQPYSPEALTVFQEARAADSQILIITGHADRVRSVAFSPDGTRVLTAAYDNTARIWDALTGRQLVQLNGHTGPVRFAAFSRDGRKVVTASLDKTARVWDAGTGETTAVLAGHNDRVLGGAFSPDARLVVTASTDNTARVWNATTGAQLRLLGGHEGAVNSAVYSPNGRHILTASADKTARIWDADSGREVAVLSGHAAGLNAAAYSVDGERIVTASDDKSARVWDARTMRELVLLSGHTQQLLDAAFSPDGSRVVTASYDKTARIWDVATGMQIALLSGHLEQVLGAAFSPDGTRVVTASNDKTARVWSASDRREVKSLIGHTQGVAGADYSPDGSRIGTASEDKTARIWDADSGKELMLLSGHSKLVLSAEFSSDGRRVVTASNDDTARIWDAMTGHELVRLEGHADSVEGAMFSYDDRHIVTASADKTARVWDALTGRQLTILSGHTATVNWAVFSPDDRRIATASTDRTTRIWDAATGRQLLVLTGHTGAVATVAFSADGTRIVTASDDKTARVWDAMTGQEELLLDGHSRVLTSAAFSRDGRHIVTSSNDRTARIWDAATGQQLLVIPHREQVETAAFSPDGLRIVTASDDKLAHIWDVQVLPVDDQIRWAEAAQLDPYSNSDRARLGLPDSPDVRHWPSERSRCDESAAAPYDPDRRASGVMRNQLVADIAGAVCDERDASANGPRSIYQRGRAEWSSGNSAEAKNHFEQALAGGYRAAGVDLAALLASPTARFLDVPRAISLYEQAWNSGVTMAAFELGALYEHGVDRPDRPDQYLLVPNESRAWGWYQKAADAGDPSALGRYADREETAAHMLKAFSYYAAAAESARRRGLARRSLARMALSPSLDRALVRPRRTDGADCRNL